MRSGIGALAVGALLCLPCVVPLLIAAGIGAGAFSAVGGWFSGQGVPMVAAAVGALSFVAAAGIVIARRTRAAACDQDNQGADHAYTGTKRE